MLQLPLHHWHLAHGGRMQAMDLYEVPVSYGVVREASSIGLADLSGFAKVSLRGPGLGDLARGLVGDGPAAVPLGVATLAGDLLACRLTEEHLLLLARTARLEVQWGGLDLKVSALDIDGVVTQGTAITNATSAYAGFGLVGDALDPMLRQLTALDVSALASGVCAQTNLAGVHAILVRAAERKAASLRVYVGSDVAEYVWERLIEAGKAWNIAPMGMDEWRAESSS